MATLPDGYVHKKPLGGDGGNHGIAPNSPPVSVGRPAGRSIFIRIAGGLGGLLGDLPTNLPFVGSHFVFRATPPNAFV